MPVTTRHPNDYGSAKIHLYLLNPLELLRTKKVLQVNQPVIAERKEPEETTILYTTMMPVKWWSNKWRMCRIVFPISIPPAVSWINVDGLRKQDVESICSHFGIHNLIQEDILSLGQRAKTDEINGILSACSICFISMRRIRPLSWSRLVSYSGKTS